MLREDEAQVWHSIVNRMPADWFSQENYGLLAQYCRHAVRARRVADLIHDAESAEFIDTEEYERRLRMQEAQSRIMASLLTKMRLTQQSTYSDKKTKPAITLNPFED